MAEVKTSIDACADRVRYLEGELVRLMAAQTEEV